MNKKRYLLPTVTIFLITFLIYFVAMLSVFLSLKQSCRDEVTTLSDEITSSLKLKTDYDAVISKYRDVSSIRITYFTEDSGDTPTADSTSTYDKEVTFTDIVSKKDTVYFESSNVLSKEYCSKVKYKADM